MTSPESTASPGMEELISALRDQFALEAPDLSNLFETHAAEAVFARRLIDSNLQHLPAGARILEVGAGSLLLAYQLRREGFAVTALEPVGEGFAHLTRLQTLVKRHADLHNHALDLVREPVERLSVMDTFAFAFSINVMEHVEDVSQALIRIVAALKSGGRYRFVCPNYTFPYEPHFNIPTLGGKKVTERLLGRCVRNSSAVVDPAGTWSSLNWITVTQVRRICRQRFGADPAFDPRVIDRFIDREMVDPRFRRRRGRFIYPALVMMRALGLLGLARTVPVRFLPAMDCTITRS